MKVYKCNYPGGKIDYFKILSIEPNKISFINLFNKSSLHCGVNKIHDGDEILDIDLKENEYDIRQYEESKLYYVYDLINKRIITDPFSYNQCIEICIKNQLNKKQLSIFDLGVQL